MVDAARRLDRAVLIGGHIDSVPNGGWLDGALNVVAGVEVLRRIAEDGNAAGHRAARQLGRRGGRAVRALALRLVAPPPARWPTRTSCARARTLTGSRCRTRCASTESSSTRRSTRAAQLESAAAYLELHIEQGPVLESMDLPLGVVLGTFGVERHQVTFRGQAAHAGSTPMDKRRDALAGAARLELEIRDIAKRTGDGAVCTMGGVVTKPGIVTSVVETAECLLDQRHLDADKLAAMLDERRAHPSSSRVTRTSKSSGSASGTSSRSCSTIR